LAEKNLARRDTSIFTEIIASMLLKSRLRFRSNKTIIGVAPGLFDDFLECEGVGGFGERLISLARLVALDGWLLLSHVEFLFGQRLRRSWDDKQIEIRGDLMTFKP
jgi:hypothetical protein